MTITRTNARQLRSVLTLCSIIWAALLSAQQPFYVSMTGSKQGKLNSGSTTRNYEGDIVGLGYTHQIVNPPLPAGTAASAAVRSHKVITFTKGVDPTSPKLMSALTSGENFPTVTFSFLAAAASGATQLYYTVTLTNARVTDVQSWFGSQNARIKRSIASSLPLPKKI